MPIDYSRYPPNWKSKIRPRILQRENNCCKFCYVKNYELVFHGKIEDGREVYQYADGSVFLYPSGKLLLYNYYDVQPISGNPNQKAIKIILTIAHLDHDEDNHNVSDDRLAAKVVLFLSRPNRAEWCRTVSHLCWSPFLGRINIDAVLAVAYLIENL